MGTYILLGVEAWTAIMFWESNLAIHITNNNEAANSNVL